MPIGIQEVRSEWSPEAPVAAPPRVARALVDSTTPDAGAHRISDREREAI